jgi:DNA-binding NarL/FixJ family response regulator
MGGALGPRRRPGRPAACDLARAGLADPFRESVCLRLHARLGEQAEAALAPEQQLVAAVRVVADGGSLFSPSVTHRLIEQFGRSSSPPPVGLDELTPREEQVLRLVARGCSNAEIAAELVVSEHTAKTHVASILQKLDLRNRVQAVVLAYESGVVRPGEWK